MRKILVGIAVAITMMTTALVADTYKDKETRVEREPYYVGIGLTVNQTTGEDGSTGVLSHRSKEFTNSGLELTAGYDLYKFSDNFSVAGELKYGASFWMEDSEDISTRNIGVFIKPIYHVGKNLNLYALVGVANVEWEGRGDTIDSTGVAYGGGISVEKDNGIGLYAEITAYPTEIYIPHIDDDAALLVLTGGIKYRF